MADEEQYPYLAENKWWKLRNLFARSLPSSVTEDYLLTNLNISSKSSASHIMKNLRLLGLIDEEGRPTERANEWRMNDQYAAVCEEIRNETYPRHLLEASLERDALVQWFMRNKGVGRGTAGSYIPIFNILREADPTAGEEILVRKKKRSTSRKQSKSLQNTKTVTPKPATDGNAAKQIVEPPLPKPHLPSAPPTPSVHIDVQIHISPDATASQIDQIFESIAKHLYQPSNGYNE